MSTNVEGGRPVARFRLAGVPVHVDLSFVLLVGFLGWFYWSRYPRDVVVVGTVAFVVVGVLSVLLHELGHAAVARTTGARPQISLAGLGGLTTFVPPRPMSRARSIAVSLAGPAVGIAAGLLLLPVRAAVEGSDLHWWVWVSLQSAVFTTLGWSLLNLLPVLPLDGGQALREVLPGDEATRERRAAMVSIGVCLVAGAAALWIGQPFLVIWVALFVMQNAMLLRRPPRRVEDLTPEQQVVALLWAGQPQRAREVLEGLPPGSVRDLAVHGAVLATTHDPEQGLALLAQERQRRPDDVDVAALTALTALVRQDWAALLAQVEGPGGAVVPDVVLQRSAEVAEAVGRSDVVERLRAASGR